MYDLRSTPEFSSEGNYLLKDGEYLAKIETAELTKSKMGNPQIKMVLDIEGKKLFEYMVLDSENQKAIQIGLSKIKSVLLALGVTNFNFRDEGQIISQMYGEIMVTIGSKDDTYNGETKLKNFVKKYSQVDNRRAIQQKVASKLDRRQDSQEIPF